MAHETATVEETRNRDDEPRRDRRAAPLRVRGPARSVRLRGLGRRFESACRAVDDDWPAPGSRFHHTVGAPGVDIKDSSKLVEVEADRRVVLEVRFRPVGIAVVSLDLEPLDGGRRTQVTMTEHPKSGPVRTWWSPLLDAATYARNAASLWRLARLSKARTATPAH